MLNQGTWGVLMGAGGPQALPQEGEEACSPASLRRAAPQGGPDFWNVCGRRWGGQAAPAGLCVHWGRAGAPVLRSTGSGPGAWLPPLRPQVPGVPEPSSGVRGYMQGSVPPPGLDPVRKEINKKGWEGG